MVRGAARAGRGVAAGRELAVYQRQMAELDDLADRGLLADDERRVVRAETGRRLLTAAQRQDAPLSPSNPARALLIAAAVPLAGAFVYLLVGAGDAPDQPFAQRLSGWRAEDPSLLNPPQMAAVLRQVAAERPTDPEPLRNLAVAELASNQPTEAAQAMQRAIALAPTRADLWQSLGEMLVVSGNGEPGPDAMAAFRRAVALDPKSASARYYLARARIAGGDVAGGLADWKALQNDLAADDPRKASLVQEIAQVSASGQLAAAAPQPGPAASMGGAAVGPAQIQAMVDGLAAQLQAQPDDPQGWVRLVRALTVLGETQRRDAALATARQRYAGKPDILAALDAATRPPS
jgi:cytochrome c-type biogenesis protein CcmH